MTKIKANRKLQGLIAIVILIFLVVDHFFLSEVMKDIGRSARANGFSKNEVLVYFLIIANLFMCIFPAWCFIASKKTKRYKKYPYPGMLVLFDTKALENEEALRMAKSLNRRGALFCLINIGMSVSILDIF